MSSSHESLENLGSVDWAELDRNVIATYRTRSRELMECTLTFIDTIGVLRQRGQKDVECIWNAACHINLVYHDLLGLIFHMSRSGEGWATSILARTLATLIHEAVDDLNHLFGKEFYQACQVADVPEILVTDLRMTKKQLSAFGNKHADLVKGIRMASGAHRDRDAIAFIISVGEASPDRLLDIATEFKEVLRSLGANCDAIIEAADETYRKRGVIP